MKKNLTQILISTVLLTSSVYACDCSGSVDANYSQIKELVSTRFTPVEKKLEEISNELDKTISDLEKESQLADEQINAKTLLYVQHNKELFQLAQIKDYYSLQNDTNNVGVKANTQLLQNTLNYDGLETEKYINNQTADFLKNKSSK